MLIFSVSFQFFRMSPRRGHWSKLGEQRHKRPFCILLRPRVGFARARRAHVLASRPFERLLRSSTSDHVRISPSIPNFSPTVSPFVCYPAYYQKARFPSVSSLGRIRINTRHKDPRFAVCITRQPLREVAIVLVKCHCPAHFTSPGLPPH